MEQHEDIDQELAKLQELFSAKMIIEEEYEKRKLELIHKLGATSLKEPIQSFSQEIPLLVSGLYSGDSEKQLQATERIRELTESNEEKESNPTTQKFIETNIVPRLVQFLASDSPQLQFAATSVLANIINGLEVNAHAVVSANAVPMLVQLLVSPHEEVREQAMTVLGNIAAQSDAYREYVLANNVMPPLLQNCTCCPTVAMLRTCAWTLSRLFSGTPPLANWDVLATALPTMAQLLYSSDIEVLTDVCEAVSRLTEGSTVARIQRVIESGLYRRLVELTLHTSPGVQSAAVIAIGNLLTGSDEQMTILIQCSLLPCLASILHSPNKDIRKDVCWMLSNITAGARDHIQMVIDANIFPRLIQLLGTDPFEVKQEIVWVLGNSATAGSNDQLRYLISLGAIQALCSMLLTPVPRVVILVLESLAAFLRLGPAGPEHEVVQIMKQSQCVGLLAQMRQNASPEISEVLTRQEWEPFFVGS